MLRAVCVADVEEAGIPALELRPEGLVEYPGSSLNHQVCSASWPAHLLAFREAPSDHHIDGGLGEGRPDPLAAAMCL